MVIMSANLDNEAALNSALTEGWVVEPPVYAMADAGRRGRRVLQFILWRAGRPRVMTVDDTAEVRAWIDGQRWPIATLR